MTVKALVVRTNGAFDYIDIDPTLKALQEVVGGYIEHVFVNDAVHCYVNEEGRIEGLDANPLATLLAGRFPVEFLHGDVIFLGEDKDDPTEEGDLPPEWLNPNAIASLCPLVGLPDDDADDDNRA